MRARPDLVNEAGPCPKQLIRRAEERVGQPFPPSYRAFLAAVGTTSFGGEEAYGLIPDNFDGFGVPNTLWLYESNVKEYGQPRRYFEFYNYGDGTTVALDLDRRRDDGEYALCETHAGASAEYVEGVEGDFGTFLLDLVRERLAHD
jgi:SMI1-KNR4 cell-wall